MTILDKVVLRKPPSKQPSNLLMYMKKRVWDRVKPCLTPILHLISFDQPSLFLKLVIKLSYNLITTTLNSKRTFESLLAYFKG